MTTRARQLEDLESTTINSTAPCSNALNQPRSGSSWTVTAAPRRRRPRTRLASCHTRLRRRCTRPHYRTRRALPSLRLLARRNRTCASAAAMGYVLSKLYTWLYGQEEIKVIIVGLDNAGKTTTLYKLYGSFARLPRDAASGGHANANCRTPALKATPARLLNEVVATTPTIGSNVEEFQYRNFHFLMWDIGGQESLRPSWSTYYVNTRVRNRPIYSKRPRDSADGRRRALCYLRRASGRGHGGGQHGRAAVTRVQEGVAHHDGA